MLFECQVHELTSCLGVDLGEFVRFTVNADGIIVASSYAIEGETLKACCQVSKSKVYPVGVQLSPSGWERTLTVKNPSLATFLEMRETNSVLYIAFG